MSYKKEYKPEIIKVRLSTPILARTRCVYCGGLPEYFYYIWNGGLYYSPSKPKTRMARHSYRMSTDDSDLSSPKYFNVSKASQYTKFKSYRPKLHRTYGSSSSLEYIEYLTCYCFRTKWAFAEKSVANRPEIAMRKARNFFPHKFEY
jgi:hypothetical protein